MDVFRRFRREPEPILATEDFSDVTPEPTLSACAEGYCEDNEPHNYEVVRGDEIMLASLEDAAEAWDSALENAKQKAAAAMKAFEAANIHFSGSTRDDRRTSNRSQQAPNAHANELARIRHDTLQHIQHDVNQKTGASTSLEQKASETDAEIEATLAQLELHLQAFRQDSGCRQLRIAYSTVEAPFTEVFLLEHIARLRLALATRQAPVVMRQYLTPANLTSLPISFQRLAAIDIGRQDRSIILSFLNSPAAVTELSGYGYLATRRAFLARMDINPAAKSALSAMTVGACAMGASRCPANQFGLCAGVAANLRFEDYPLEVQKDMARKQADSTDKLVRGLQSFTKMPGLEVSRWWQSAGRVPFIGNDSSRASGRRKSKPSGQTAAPTAQSLQASLAAAKPEQVSGQENLIVSWRDSEEPAVMCMRDPKAREAAIETILQTEEFSQYLSRYAEEKGLRATLTNALSLILFSNRYRDVPSIVKMSYAEPHYTRNGEALPVWRFSGNQLVDAAGKVGRDTRIYFGMKGDHNTRILHIIGVRHKTAISKRMAGNKIV